MSIETEVTTKPTGSSRDLAAVEQLSAAYQTMAAELGKVIVGQQEVVEQVLTAMFCRGMYCWWACRGWPRRCW